MLIFDTVSFSLGKDCGETFAAWFGAYLAHRTHHHRLARVFEWTCLLSMGEQFICSARHGGTRSSVNAMDHCRRKAFNVVTSPANDSVDI